MAEDNCDVGSVGLGGALDAFREFDEVNEIINKLPYVYGDAVAAESSFERFVYILNLYQEQPHLLGPYLDDFLRRLLCYCKEESPDNLRHLSFKLLYIITKVRGCKIVVRHLPHEVIDLELILTLLSKECPSDRTHWETQYILLLWLSIVVKVPFHMERLDGALDADGNKRKPIAFRILDVIKLYLQGGIGAGGKITDAAAFLACHFLSRPDMKDTCLPEFLDWSVKLLKECDSNTLEGENLQSGILVALAMLFKHGRRDVVKKYGEIVLKSVLDCDFKNSKNVLVQKMALKVIQRIGMSFLPTKLAAWRYSRGNRSLAANLSSTKNPEYLNISNHVPIDPIETDEEDFDIPKEIEDIVEQLLTGLHAKQTIVRYSAAKGIARITSRLPWELAEDIITSILELFCVSEGDAAWHGGCLALAELGRRGLILPSVLDKVIPVILKALVYDELLGNFSIGAHIRDAACYICWSFARAFEPSVLKPYVKDIATALIITAVFDREVNCRRAASSAFQENVGRQGTFPHGIDILTAADYYSVGSRSNAFLDVSVYVAQFDEYTKPLIDHLIEHKINHWDKSLRELASKALHNLTVRAPEYMCNHILPKLLLLSIGADLNTRHGAILGSAEIIHALHELSQDKVNMPNNLKVENSLEDIRKIVIVLNERRQFRGLGGILMRLAVCCLIEKCSLSHLPVHQDVELIAEWQNLIDSCLVQVEEEVRLAATRALSPFCEEYYKDNELAASLLDRYLKQMESGQLEVCSGHLCAVGALPRHILLNKVNNVMESLMACVNPPVERETWVEMKRDAIKAIECIVFTVGVDTQEGGDVVFNKSLLQTIYNHLLIALGDYTLDSRGDIGTIVREAAMVAIQNITSIIVRNDPSFLSSDIVSQIFCCILQQCVEQIDRTRCVAGKTFSSLLHSKPEVPHIPHKEELKEVFPSALCESIDWASSAHTFPHFVQFLSLEIYTYNLLLGLTMSVGGLTESLVKHSRASLINFLSSIQSDSAKISYICKNLLKVLSENLQNDRIVVSYFRMIDHLLSSDVLLLDETKDGALLSTLLNLCWKAVAKTSDTQKLIAVVDVFCSFLQFSGPCSKIALSTLTIFLCHRFPRVRKVTASKLYEAILSYSDVVPEASLDDAMLILSDTNWDSPVKALRPVRNDFCRLCGISPPIPVQKT